MRQFTAVFHGEGDHDYWFTKEIARLTLERLLMDYEVVVIELPKGRQHMKEDEWIEHVSVEYVALDMIVFHFDADMSWQETKRNRFAAGQTLAHRRDDANHVLVPIIPVRATEAWMLVDFEAFCKVTRLKGKASDYQFPARAREVEKIPSEAVKQHLKTAFSAAAVPKEMEADVLRQLAEATSVARLQAIPAYQRFQRDVEQLLIEQQYL